MVQHTPAVPPPEGADDESPAADPQSAEQNDPHAGMSDDPRVDPTPDRRQSEK